MGKVIISNEALKNFGQNIFFLGCVLLSIALFCFALAVTFEALFNGQTTTWKGVLAVVAIILLFYLMYIIVMLEGMQIAFFDISKLPKE